MKTRASIGAALAAALLLTGCAGLRSEARPGGGDSPIAPKPDPSSPVPEPTPLPVEPRHGLVDVRPHPWEDVAVRDQRTIDVTFWDGVEACYGLARVRVHYAPDAVTVTLFTGRVPTAEVCIELALLKVVRIDLDEPLAGRTILDGAQAK